MKFKIPTPSSPTQGQITNAVLRIDDTGELWMIPFDPANTDYQAYLQWLSEGNEPLPADNEGTV